MLQFFKWSFEFGLKRETFSKILNIKVHLFHGLGVDQPFLIKCQMYAFFENTPFSFWVIGKCSNILPLLFLIKFKK